MFLLHIIDETNGEKEGQVRQICSYQYLRSQNVFVQVCSSIHVKYCNLYLTKYTNINIKYKYELLEKWTDVMRSPCCCLKPEAVLCLPHYSSSNSCKQEYLTPIQGEVTWDIQAPRPGGVYSRCFYILIQLPGLSPGSMALNSLQRISILQGIPYQYYYY